MKNSKHSFVVCAYGESLFLKDCIESLIHQSVKSDIIVATSTPNDLIKTIACDYDLPLYIRSGEPGIANDWNYALSCSNAPFVTIAHQDDVYDSSYAERAINTLSQVENPLIFFSNYGEIRDGKRLTDSPLLKKKRKLLTPYRIKGLNHTKLVKRIPISIGNPICCPSVTYVPKNLPSPLFNQGLRSNLDWDAWERLSSLPGRFLYDPLIGMYHRVHSNSETSACIADDTRTKEDFELLSRFWPNRIAKLINTFYVTAQKYN